MKKIAYIITHPAPYNIEFATRIADNKQIYVDIFSMFTNDAGHLFWDISLPDGRRRIINLGGDRISGLRFAFRLLKTFVFTSKYDLIVWPGWTYKCLYLPIFLSALLSKSYGLSADSVEQKKTTGLIVHIKAFVIRKARLLFVPGIASKRFFNNYYKKESCKILVGAYALDGILLEKTILQRRANNRNGIRLKYGINESARMYLMVANMIPSRCYPITARAFAGFSKLHNNVVFVMVGDGPDSSVVKDMARDNPSLKVLGGCSFDDMLSLYSAADIYVHGGKEPASTALVIGAISHLPIISSANVGCSADVLSDGISGYEVHDYLDENEWSLAFHRSYNDSDNWKEKGSKARELSQKMDVDAVIGKFIGFINEL